MRQFRPLDIQLTFRTYFLPHEFLRYREMDKLNCPENFRCLYILYNLSECEISNQEPFNF